ncbi:unnamed protein product [Absidia cylindrospora]
MELCPQCQQLVYLENTAPEAMLEKHVASECQLYLYPPTSIAVPSGSAASQCAVEKCRDLNPRIGPAHCVACDQDFCLKHRYQVKHNCPQLQIDPKEVRRLAAKEKLAKTFKPSPSIPTTVKSTSVTGTKKSSPMVELMKIKAKAKGLTSVPMASRMYLYIEFPQDSIFAGQQKPMYLDKYNRVGKTLDMLADHGRVKNENNMLLSDDDERLGLYLMDSAGNYKPLDMSSTLETAVEQMDTLLLKRK